MSTSPGTAASSTPATSGPAAGTIASTTQPDGAVTQARVSNYRGGGAYRGIVVFPRLSWKIDDANELNLSAGMQASSHAWSGFSHNDNLVGAFGDPDWIDMPGRSSGDQWMMRGEIGWIAKAGGGKLDLSLSGERSRDGNDNTTDYFSAGRAHHLLRDWDTVYRPRRMAFRSKFTRALFDGHALATGVDASRQRNDDSRDRRDQQDDAPATHVVESFRPEVARLAAFVQDEWSVTKQLSVYAGGRWEGVRTDSGTTASRSHVLTLPEDEREALLGDVDALARTHPDLARRDEVALPYVTRCWRARRR